MKRKKQKMDNLDRFVSAMPVFNTTFRDFLSGLSLQGDDIDEASSLISWHDTIYNNAMLAPFLKPDAQADLMVNITKCSICFTSKKSANKAEIPLDEPCVVWKNKEGEVYVCPTIEFYTSYEGRYSYRADTCSINLFMASDARLNFASLLHANSVKREKREVREFAGYRDFFYSYY